MTDLPRNERLLAASDRALAFIRDREARPVDALDALQDLDFGSYEGNLVLGVLCVTAPAEVIEAVGQVVADRTAAQRVTADRAAAR